MNNNDVLRSLRFALKLSDARVVEVFALAGHTLTPTEARALTGREEEDDAEFCTDAMLGLFLDGLVIHRRGARPGATAPVPVDEISNNEILKKIRIALTLRDDDLIEMLAAGGQKLSKSELSALFRKPEHRHFRHAGDQVLRKFLRGLTLRLRPETATPT